MLIVPCPNCGPRNASDLRYVGEARARPDPNDVDPAGWRTYLYTESNPAGPLRETWYCAAGCRRFFVLERDTVTNEFAPSPLPGDKSGGRG